MVYDIVVVGAGLGGLEFGYLAAKKGLKVCVVEKNAQIGGCLQTYKRHGHVFDTGFHYVGGLAEGEPLNVLFKELDLLDLPWIRLDSDAFDVVYIGNDRYHFANGYENFAERVVNDYKSNGYSINKETENGVRQYSAFLKDIGDKIFSVFHDYGESNMPLFSQAAYQFLKNTIIDEKLTAVVSSTSMKMELRPETFPLYTFAQINSSFIKSAWRIEGGGMQIAERLANGIKSFGGDVITNAEVTKFIENEGVIKAVEINGGDAIIEGRRFVSDLHPALTLSLIPKEGSLIKNIFRKRISSLGNTYGMFTVSLKLKAGKVPYLNKNIYIHSSYDSIWKQSEFNPNFEGRSLMVSYQTPNDGSNFTQNIDILMPMYWEEIGKWEGTKVGQRGDDYKDMKQVFAEKCIDNVTLIIPELKGNIEEIYTSTPLSYLNYTGTIHGSAYGIRKDCDKAPLTILMPNTSIPNLCMTGQNLNLHGVLGTTITTFMLFRSGWLFNKND